ncbi:MAG: DnaJ domain-containing protein [Rhizonema sp. PD38]|nr:DnaJ domain-containing protein [Rhizonema sp. PD38]
MTYELYQLLEVSPQASSDEIKRAYFRLVRQYCPEKYPEEFKQIRTAYNTLYDSKARDNYDSLQQYGNQIKNLISQAEEKMNVEDCHSAISLLKQVLVLVPTADDARNLLGLCYIHTQNWDFAIKIYRSLTKNNPDVAVYWSNFGHVYKQQAEFLEDNDVDTKLYQNARECFQRAIKLESFNSEPYLEIARTYLDEKRYAEALAWAELAIGADGKVDAHDFDAMLFICRVHLFNGQLHKIEETAQIIASLLPDNEARQYAASRFANLGLEVARVGAKLSDTYILRAALLFLNVARDFDKSDLDIKELYERVEEMIAALDQYELLKQDSLILYSCQRLAEFCLADYFSLHDFEEDRKTLLDDIMAEFFNVPAINIISSIMRIKSHYPAIYRLNKDLFDSIEQTSRN